MSANNILGLGLEFSHDECQTKSLSIREVHVQDHLNSGADLRTASPGGESHNVWPSRSGRLCVEHDYALPTLIYLVSPVDSSGCPGPRMAQDQSLCFYPDPVVPSGSTQSKDLEKHLRLVAPF